MGILIVTWNFPPRRGGIENLMSHLSTGLTKKNSVIVITAHDANASYDDVVFRAPWPGLVVFVLYAAWRGAMTLMRDPQVRIVFGGSVMVAPVVLVLARLFRRKAVVQAHGLDLVYPSIFYQALCVRWLRYCDRAIANSHYTASLASERGVLGQSISVIPLGVDTMRFSPAANAGELKRVFGLEGKSIILFVGRLARRKGVKEFVQLCLPMIVEEIPLAIFVVAGSNPTESLVHHDDVQSELRTMVRKLGLEDHVRLRGEVSNEELVKLYQACDVVVLPALESSRDVEGFGLVLLEAAAVGKPVVATRVGGISDAVAAGKSGFLLEAGDYRGLSNAIVDLLRDEDKRKTMGDLGKLRVHTEFSWQTVVRRYEEAFLAVGHQ